MVSERPVNIASRPPGSFQQFVDLEHATMHSLLDEFSQPRSGSVTPDGPTSHVDTSSVSSAFETPSYNARPSCISVTRSVVKRIPHASSSSTSAVSQVSSILSSHVSPTTAKSTTERDTTTGESTPKRDVTTGESTPERYVTTGECTPDRPVTTGESTSERDVATGGSTLQHPVTTGASTPERADALYGIIITIINNYLDYTL